MLWCHGEVVYHSSFCNPKRPPYNKSAVCCMLFLQNYILLGMRNF